MTIPTLPGPRNVAPGSHGVLKAAMESALKDREEFDAIMSRVQPQFDSALEACRAKPELGFTPNNVEQLRTDLNTMFWELFQAMKAGRELRGLNARIAHKLQINQTLKDEVTRLETAFKGETESNHEISKEFDSIKTSLDTIQDVIQYVNERQGIVRRRN